MGYALLTSLAFPPIGLWPLALIAILPLVWAGCRIGGAPQHRRGWILGLLATLGAAPLWLFEERWMLGVTALGYPFMAVYLSLYAGAFVWLVAAARRRVPRLPMSVVVPLGWTGLEILRSEVVMTGYPWFLAGHPLIEAPAPAAPAAVLGAYSVSFLVAVLAGAVADLAGWSGAARPAGGVAVAATAIAWGGLAWLGWRGDSAAAAQGPAARIAVIQTNVPQDNKIGWTPEQRREDFDRFMALTRRAAAAEPRPSVIVWPETMFPGDALNPEAIDAERSLKLVWPGGPGRPEVPVTVFADELLEAQRALGVPMVIGSIAADGLRGVPGEGRRVKLVTTARYNSAMVVADGRVQPGRYDKMALTPFGEVIPYVWRWPALQQAVLSLGAAGMSFDLAPGGEARVLRVPIAGPGGAAEVRFATPICFEVTKAAVVRDLAYQHGRPRADVILNLSNDGWFGGWRGGREQHLQAARWRCVELGLPMVRAVNTGISAQIDPHGRVVKQGPDGADRGAGVAGVMVASVSVGNSGGGTIYGAVGGVFGWVVLGGFGGLVLWIGRAGRGAGPVGAGAAVGQGRVNS